MTSCPGCGAPASARCGYCGRSDGSPLRMYVVRPDTPHDVIAALQRGEDGFAFHHERPPSIWGSILSGARGLL